MNNASISGTFHIVTSDGAGPLSAMVDTTGLGDFSNAVKATVTTQVPGTKGNIKKTTKRWEELAIRAGLMKRATNINEDYPFAVAIPAVRPASLTWFNFKANYNARERFVQVLSPAKLMFAWLKSVILPMLDHSVDVLLSSNLRTALPPLEDLWLNPFVSKSLV